jgi:hypothetical protein
MVTLWTSSPDRECGLNALSVRVMFTCISSGAAGAAADTVPRRCGCRPRAAGGRPLAGLEFVEKLLTSAMVALLCWIG